MRKTKVWFILLCFLLAMTMVPMTVSANKKQIYTGPISFQVGGTSFLLPESEGGFLYQGSFYVPIRLVSVSLNKGIRWDGKERTLQLVEPTELESSRNLDALQEMIAQSAGTKLSGTERKLKASIETITAMEYSLFFMQGERMQERKQTVYNLKSRIYVPLRLIAEAFQVQLIWHPKTLTVEFAADEATNAAPSSPPGTGKDGGGKAQDPSAGITDGTSGGGKGDADGNTAANPGGGSTANPGSGGGGGGIPGSGGGAVPGGSGSTPSKPAYDSLVAAADVKISALKSRSQRELTALYLRYMATDDRGEKDRLRAEGQSKLSGYDAEFEGILSELKVQLEAGGYSTAIIADYRSTYEQEKQDAMNGLKG